MLHQLTLIGTVHRDPQGYPRLVRLLRQLQPDRLTLEMSPYALNYRRSRSADQYLRLERILDQLAAAGSRSRQELAAHPAIADISTLLALPFEYRAASDFCAERGIDLALVDDSEVSARKLKRVGRSLISRRNLEVLIDLPAEQDAPSGMESYRQAARLLDAKAGRTLRQAFLAGRRGVEGIGPRDRGMAEKIRRVWRQGGEHLVHIGGWVHLVADEQEETLYSLLADLQPVRLLLDAGATPSTSCA